MTPLAASQAKASKTRRTNKPANRMSSERIRCLIFATSKILSAHEYEYPLASRHHVGLEVRPQGLTFSPNYYFLTCCSYPTLTITGITTDWHIGSGDRNRYYPESPCWLEDRGTAVKPVEQCTTKKVKKSDRYVSARVRVT